MQRFTTLVRTFWKVLVGGALSQFPLTSLLVIGWTYRAMQRTALRVWQRQSPLDETEIALLQGAHPLFARHTRWPNWFLAPQAIRNASGAERKSFLGRVRGRVGALLGSLGANFRIGFAGLITTWTLTAVPVILWTYAWYAGWNNSFAKGYEQAFVGPITSLLAIALFLIVMLYLPFAQARQAVTGDWRSFYQLRTVWTVALQRPLASVFIALAYTAVSLPISILLVVPLFFEQMMPSVASMSDTEFLAFLSRYYFRVSVAGFLGYVAVRHIAARFYAAGVIAAIRAGRLCADDLSGDEAAALCALHIGVPAERTIHKRRERVGWLAWRTAPIALALALWFTFVAQLYVREFLVYHPARGWLNQPLVQAPAFRFIPQALEHAVRDAVPR